VDIFVARQPIFDERKTVYAYELLFRSGPENFFSHPDADDASRRVIDNAFHVFGLDTLSSNKKLFINTTRKVLLEDLFGLFPPAVAVVEVLETVEVDAPVLRALAALKAQGYTIALDDFVFRPGCEPLVALADVIKVDFLLTQGAERGEVVRRFGRPGLQFLAEKVETQAEFDDAARAGYTLFQGYFFAKPQMLDAKEVPVSKLAKLRLMQALLSDQTNYEELEHVLKADLALSVKLLRYLNSASFGWRAQITSLRHALTLLGDRPFRQWASLIALTMLGDDKPAELVLTCLVRARFCEQLGLKLALRTRPLDLFLVGLLSALDALLGRPLPEALDLVAVSPAVRGALLDGAGELADLYRAVLAYERADWEEPSLRALAVNADLPELYRKAVAWAQAL
jgi:EAL and modified HD-GYP domain-containing signal transduction protein